MNSEFDVAIVGMAGRFPGARTLEAFWKNLAEGAESITRFSDMEMLESGVPAEYLTDPSYVKAAPVLEQPGHFDAGFFGFSPVEARTLDPQHRLILELAYEALEHAGYDPERYQGRIGVFTGAALNTYFTYAGLHGRLTHDYIPTLIANDKDFLSTRISYKLNLKGPSLTVQTACSTSMVAVHLARQSLLTQEIDMALAGAVSVRVPHRAGYFYDDGGVVSPDARVKTFDARANGTVFGSGGGILVLKRLADARADGDTVHAVVKGSAVTNDGSEKAGYTAPSVNSQADAVVEALANAGIDADSVTYLEAHGSGTPVGDPIEIRALTKAFRTFTPRSGYCAIGSVKTNIGHLDAAAAVAGIIKTVLALKHRQIPPSLHFHEPNPEIDFPTTPFYVNTALREWTSEGPRRAGVMSTGMGGTNAHLVLEEAPDPGASIDAGPQLLILSAKTATALDRATKDLAQHLERNPGFSLADVAYTLQVGRKAFNHRRIAVCEGPTEAVSRLGSLDSKWVKTSSREMVTRDVIFMFPGQGSQYVNMGYGLYQANPGFRSDIDRCADILRPHLGFDLRDVIYPSQDTNIIEASERLQQTSVTQPALFAIEWALSQCWMRLGVRPAAMVGHSIGEYVAACVAGVLALEDALALVATRGRLMQHLPAGSMLAVSLSETDIQSWLAGSTLSVAAVNGPSRCVVSGEKAQIEALAERLVVKGVECGLLKTSHAFHSRMMDPILERFEIEAEQVSLKPPRIPFISNVTGSWITPHEATAPAYWAAHLRQTVRIADGLGAMLSTSNRLLLEIGPGQTLTALAIQHPNRSQNHVILSSTRHPKDEKSDVAYMLSALGELWLAGVQIDWPALHPDARSTSPRRRVALPTYPFERQDYWLTPIAHQKKTTHIRGSVQKNPNASDWFYLPSWKRLLPHSAGADDLHRGTENTRPWLVFADDGGFTSALIARLRSAGHEVLTVKAGTSFQRVEPRAFIIEPGNVQHYDLLIRTLRADDILPAHVIHAWGVTALAPAQLDGDGFERAQVLGFYSLIHLAQALAAHHVGHEIHLVALSNHVQDVSGAEALQPAKATLLGPCIVIRQEYPNIRTKSIDLDVTVQANEYESAAGLVLGECLHPDSNLFVAYRNGQRWVQTYEPVALGKSDRSRSPFRERGVYLITGGLGAIGLAISEYLATSYRARLVLVGRSSQRTTDILERLEALGAQVLYATANVADVVGMRKAVDQAYQLFGTLHGVIHAAGIVRNDGLQEISACEYHNCERHFEAKVRGLHVLEDVLRGKSVDFCLLVSSLTPVLGGIGHVAYASSNAYMDSFARWHNRSHPVPWLSVNFDLWRFPDLSSAAPGFGRTTEDLGHTPEEAIAAMETVLLTRNASQLLVSTGDLAARVRQWVELESLSALESSTGASPTLSLPSHRSAQQTRSDAPCDDIQQRIARIWQETLGIDELGIHDRFTELGGDSLLALKIVAELRKAFQIALPVKAIFAAPTVAELSSHIKQLLIAEIEALSDEEAERLVSR